MADAPLEVRVSRVERWSEVARARGLILPQGARILADVDQLERIVADLREDLRVRLVYLFGSRARGEAAETSDTDIAVLLDRKLDWRRERGLRGRLAAASGAEPDLVILNDAGVVLRHEVVTGGRCLFARDTREQAEFEIQAVSQFLDFQPVLRFQDESLRARVEERRRGSAN